MKLPDLKKLNIENLKNIDWLKLIEQFRSRPDRIINVLAVVITFFFCTNFYSKHQDEIRNVKYEISTLETKIHAIEEFDSAQAELDKFLKGIPPGITEDQLINQITDYAVAHNIQIQSFSPAKKQSQPLYDLTSIILKITAENYVDLWQFINEIEKSPYPMHVDNWSGAVGPPSTPQRVSRRPSDQDIDVNNLVLNVQLEIAAVNIKNE